MLEAGGLSQQPARYVDAMHVVDATFKRLRQARIKKGK